MANKNLIKFTILLATLTITSLAYSQSQRSVEWYLDQFDRRYRFAEQLLSAGSSPYLSTLLQQAKQQRDKAVTAFGNGERQLAIVHLTYANKLVDQIIQNALRIPLQRLRDQLNELLQRAERTVVGSGNMEAERLLKEAKNQKNKAAQAWLQKRYQASLEHSRVAKYLAQRAIDLVKGPVKNLADRAAEEKERYNELLNTARNIVNSSNNQLAKQVLDQAVRQGLGVKPAINRGNYALALDLYYKSTRLLLRAINIAEGQLGSIEEQAREAMSRLDELISSTETQMQSSNDATSRILMQNAKDIQNRALNNFNTGRYQRVIQNVDLAEGIVMRLMRRLTRPSNDTTSRVQQELDRLQVELNSVRESIQNQDNQEIQAFFSQAQYLAQKAEIALLRGQPRSALELILAANRLLVAGEKLGTSGPEKAIEVADIQVSLQRLDRHIDETNQAISGNKGPAFDMLEHAKTLRFEANEAIQQEKFSLADNLIQIALDLCQKARKM